MTSIVTLPYAQALAWSLVHFLWQGAALGLAAFVCLRFMRLSASARHAIGVITLALMVAAPVVTFVTAAPAARARIASLRAPERERAGVGPRSQLILMTTSQRLRQRLRLRQRGAGPQAPLSQRPNLPSSSRSSPSGSSASPVSPCVCSAGGSSRVGWRGARLGR